MKKVEIKPNDIVEYEEAEYSAVLRKTIKVKKWGVWDGEKVVLNDLNNTTVYKKEWLTVIPLKTNADKIKFIIRWLEDIKLKTKGEIDKGFSFEVIGRKDIVDILNDLIKKRNMFKTILFKLFGNRWK